MIYFNQLILLNTIGISVSGFIILGETINLFNFLAIQNRVAPARQLKNDNYKALDGSEGGCANEAMEIRNDLCNCFNLAGKFNSHLLLAQQWVQLLA